MKVLIADDHHVVRKRLREIMLKDRAVKEVSEVDNGYEAIEMTRKRKFDVIILDISMPGMNGIETLKQLKKESPKIPVLILSMYPEEHYSLRAIKAGAAAYLTKETTPEELMKAVKTLAHGGKYISSGTSRILADALGDDGDKLPHELLSDREFEVFRALSRGRSIREISETLAISTKTVHTYRARILQKLHMKSNADLITYAMSHQLFDSR